MITIDQGFSELFDESMFYRSMTTDDVMSCTLHHGGCLVPFCQSMAHLM